MSIDMNSILLEISVFTSIHKKLHNFVIFIFLLKVGDQVEDQGFKCLYTDLIYVFILSLTCA